MVKQFIVLTLALFLIVGLSGCGKKKETLEEIQEPLSIEISPLPAAADAKLAGGSAPGAEKITAIPLPPQGPYKPTDRQIQTALKNAGYYAERVDGKIGPLTKEAIKKFQEANNLKVDGKVGPRTWEALSRHLSQQQPEPAEE